MREKYYYIIYVFLALVVLGPGLDAGHLFLIDMPWPEDLHLHRYLSNGPQHQLPLTALFTALDWLMPAWVVQKLILLAALSSAGAGAHALAKRLSPSIGVAITAGVLGMLNPFVAERLFVGQWLVIAGLGMSAYVLARLIDALRSGKRNDWIILAGVYSLLPIISVHWWFMTTPTLLLPFLLRRFGYYKKIRVPSRKLAAASAAAFLGINSYWLINLLRPGSKLNQITNQDFEVFQTVGDPTFGLSVNVLSLYGFWSDLAKLPKDYLPTWWVYGLGLAVLALVGLFIKCKTSKHSDEPSTAVTRSMVYCLPLIIPLALGYNSAIGSAMIELLDGLPGFPGLRETGKSIGALALLVAVYGPIAAYHYARRVGLAILLLLAAVHMSPMLLGGLGQLKTSSYPESWQEANAVLANIDTPVLLLPWKGYIDINFAGNTNVANPGIRYFDADVQHASITGNPLLDGAQSELDELILSQYDEQWIEDVSSEGFTHALLLKTDSWSNFRALLDDGQVIYDSPEVAVIQLR